MNLMQLFSEVEHSEDSIEFYVKHGLPSDKYPKTCTNCNSDGKVGWLILAKYTQYSENGN